MLSTPGVVPIPRDVQQRYAANGLWNGVRVREGLERHARRTPQRLAIVDESGTWSYSRLAAAVAHCVGGLRSRGVGSGSVVMILAPLSAPAVVTYQAVIRSGGASMMMDRRSGRMDFAQALGAVNVDLVVSTPELLETFEAEKSGPPTATFDALLGFAQPVTDWEEPDPSHPITVVFTSGTTSGPKGVVHCLNTLQAGGRNIGDAVLMTADDRAFLSSPLASITGLVQTHLMLDNGGALILEDHFDPQRSLASVTEHGATILGGAPIIVEELFKQAKREEVRHLPLRALALGGSMIPRDVLELAVNRFGITPVRMYGASEIPSATSSKPSDVGEARLDNDGACSEGTEVVVDDATGEILVRGPMRCLGYLNEEDNRAAFVEDGWYRTGDLGTFMDGRLTITGRLKEVATRKGMKISLNEIDEVMRTLPHVEDAFAFAMPDDETGERVAVAILSEEAGSIDFESIVNGLLTAGLPKWKLPEQIVLWQGPFPRTESGKVQRRILGERVHAYQSLFAPRLRR
jgi:acyl-CoA synthetase (AMP-forming)/AMP-acid ligase II